jgi:glycerol-3-phosphate dehydrogenase
MAAQLEKVVILGAGSFGTAIGAVFARQGHPVCILDRKPERCQAINETHHNPSYVSSFELPPSLTATTDPAVAFADCSLIFHAIPIQSSVEYLSALKPHIQKHMVLISMSKGIHCESLKFMNDIIADVFGAEQPCAFLSGPSFAKEVLSYLHLLLID